MRLVRLMSLLLAGAVFGLLVGQSVVAQPPSATFTLQPGGRATIAFEAFCNNFGQRFPTSIQAPNAVAPDRVRAALAFIRDNNLGADPSRALEAQYGLWRVVGATDSPAGGEQARAVVNAANNAPPAPTGTSLIEAAQNGQVRVTVASWQPVGDRVQLGTASDHFYGRGTLNVENVSQQVLELYMPVGTLFPPAAAGEQTMAGYQTNVQVNEAQAAQPTTQPTVVQQQAAQPVQPTAEPTAQATAVPQQAVQQAQPTAQPTTQPTARPTVQPTAQPTPQRPGTLPETSGSGWRDLLLVIAGLLFVAFFGVRRLRRSS